MKKITMLFIVILFSLLNVAALAASFAGAHSLCHTQTIGLASTTHAAHQEHGAGATGAIPSAGKSDHCKNISDSDNHIGSLGCCSGLAGILPITELYPRARDHSNTYTASVPTKPVSQFLEPIFKPPKHYA